jgi:hypothetical protein
MSICWISLTLLKMLDTTIKVIWCNVHYDLFAVFCFSARYLGNK